MNDDIINELQRWKDHRFRTTDLKMDEVVASLKSDAKLVQARQLGKSKDYWAYFDPQTNKPAVVTFAMLWTWNSPFDTGNFVPEGKEIPPNLSVNRVQHVPSPKCVYTCAFDTNHDPSLYKNVEVIEACIQKDDGFNHFQRPKYTWQDPENSSTNHRYIFSSRVFSKRTPYNCSSDGKYSVPYTVHPWIKAACEASEKKWVPCKDKSRLLVYKDKRFQELARANPPYFEKGDIVWMSFVIAFTMQTSSWMMSLQPLEFVRVATTELPAGGPQGQSTDMADLLHLEPLGGGEYDDQSGQSTKRRRDEDMADGNYDRVTRDSPPWDIEEQGTPEAVANDMERMDISEEAPPATKKRASGRKRAEAS
ncbi:hypothetical protein BKA70DRAFT_1416554 [Coprinopsis sp. MPI-PUGE-AT-0042]|nr:hypothetical protein BKA70DRAFT_1416554 [Coprinopsis sp. MPI-PUGE-AT-0042]